MYLQAPMYYSVYYMFRLYKMVNLDFRTMYFITPSRVKEPHQLHVTCQSRELGNYKNLPGMSPSLLLLDTFCWLPVLQSMNWTFLVKMKGKKLHLKTKTQHYINYKITQMKWNTRLCYVRNTSVPFKREHPCSLNWPMDLYPINNVVEQVEGYVLWIIWISNIFLINMFFCAIRCIVLTMQYNYVLYKFWPVGASFNNKLIE